MLTNKYRKSKSVQLGDQLQSILASLNTLLNSSKRSFQGRRQRKAWLAPLEETRLQKAVLQILSKTFAATFEREQEISGSRNGLLPLVARVLKCIKENYSAPQLITSHLYTALHQQQRTKVNNCHIQMGSQVYLGKKKALACLPSTVSTSAAVYGRNQMQCNTVRCRKVGWRPSIHLTSTSIYLPQCVHLET